MATPMMTLSKMNFCMRGVGVGFAARSCSSFVGGGHCLAGSRSVASRPLQIQKIANASRSDDDETNINIHQRLPLQLSGHLFRRDNTDRELRFNIDDIGTEVCVAGRGVGDVSDEKHKNYASSATGKAKDNPDHIYFDFELDISPIYQSLADGATEHTCISVYDGDTLTLEDSKGNRTKVRLAGIDTPEIRGNEAFSLEAKQYTMGYCQEKTIYLTYLASGGSVDCYGRLLAYVWVPVTDLSSGKGGWLCVNEGLVVSGLAHVYSPSNTKKGYHYNKLIRQQRYGRINKLGQWELFINRYVITTPKGRAFHSTCVCTHLTRSTNLTVLTASEAYDKGLHPCRDCSPNI